jgi:Leucine-rich repeat (LRR) protein
MPTSAMQKQLTYLDISSNNLSANIPTTLGNCDSLEYIEMGHNAFSGSIPTSLGNITSLQILNMSHNNLFNTGVSWQPTTS